MPNAIMLEFYPDLVAFYRRPLATVNEINQARIRGTMMAESKPKAKKTGFWNNLFG